MVCLAAPMLARAQTAETPYAVAEVRADLPIPDNDAVTGAAYSIYVPGGEPLEELQVSFEIDHPAVEQLIVSLVHPGGESIILHNRTPSDDAPFHPVYDTLDAPAEPLSRFLNRSPMGEWKLRVLDLVEGATGTLIGWGLKVKPASAFQTPPPTPVPLPAELFAEQSRFTVGAAVTGVETADMNGDGLDDLFLLYKASNRVDLFTSSGSGLISIPLNMQIDAPSRVATGDVNGDDLVDFVAASQASGSASVHLTVFLANDAGGFASGFQADVSLTTALDALTLVDVNDDGALDLIVGGIPKIFTGVGDGTFKLEGDLIGLGRRFLAKGDLDGDGRDELFITRSRGGTSSNVDPYILFSSPDLNFLNAIKLTLTDPTLQRAFAARPIDPARVELAAFSPTGEVDPTLYFSRVRLEDDGSVSTDEARLPAGSVGFPLRAYDLNADGLSDFVFPAAGGVRAFQRTDGPTGGRTQTVFSVENPVFAAPGRFFSDGRVGLVVIDSKNNVIVTASLLQPLPTATPGAPAPTATPFLFPPDPTVTPTPQVTPTPMRPTPVAGDPDLNGDGVVDAKDLLILIQHWGDGK